MTTNDKPQQKLIRLTTIQMAWLQGVAKRNGCSVAQVIRDLVRSKMEETSNA